jgi:hypothetical protein
METPTIDIETETAAFEAPSRSNEPVRIISWRRKFATELGFDEATAIALSLDTTDLHTIETMVKQGCTAELALSILN